MYLPMIKVHFETKSVRDLSNDASEMFFCLFFFLSDLKTIIIQPMYLDSPA